MMHPIFRVVSVSVIGSNTLRITFNDALQRDIDFSPVLGGELFRPLRDPALFAQVKVDPEVHTIVWPNGADFDPATLHDWPVYCDALAARVREWERAAA